MVSSTSSAAALLLSAAALLSLLTTPVSSDDHLIAFEFLAGGESLEQGTYLFIMQTDCNLVLYDKNMAVWSTRTDGKGLNCVVIMQRYGNLVIYSDGIPIWASSSNRREGKYYLLLQEDRNVVIYDNSNNNNIWMTGSNFVNAAVVDRLNVNESIWGGQSLKQGTYLFTMQKACNLVLYENNKAAWSTGTDGKGLNCPLIMQRDGNLVIYSGNIPIWASNTNGQNGDYYLLLQKDRNVAIYDNSNSNNAIWTTRTNVVNAAVVDIPHSNGTAAASGALQPSLPQPRRGWPSPFKTMEK